MKKSQLRQLIREEIRSVLVEKKIAHGYDLFLGRMGDGLSVFNREEKGPDDYKPLAKIHPQNGKITWYDKKLPPVVKQHIEKMAKEEHKQWKTKALTT